MNDKLKKVIRGIEFYLQNSCFINKDSIRCYNFWSGANEKNLWFTQSIIEHSNIKLPVNFYSVFGDINKVMWDNKTKIFFTGENLENYPEYKDYNYLNLFDLYIGFDNINHPNYLRLPLWILYYFNTNDTIDTIKNKILLIENKKSFSSFNSRDFCCMVASHDKNGLREIVFSKISKFHSVSSGGNLLNNTNDLQIKFADNKLNYLSNFKFNIALENSNSQFYTTEKIFDSIFAGCIPIYWGSMGNPEPEILNQKRIIFFDEERDGFNMTNTIDTLINNPAELQAFYELPVFSENAAEEIYKIINCYNDKLKYI
jgi:hypothetical protein